MRATTVILISFATAWLISAPAAAQSYEKATSGTRELVNQSGTTTIRMLVEAANLGGTEVEVGEIVFAAGSAPQRGHVHGSVEIFYVLSGVLEHVVNGISYTLTPGMVGIVRPGDEVVHRVPDDADARALVISAPGGEAARIGPAFKERRLDKGSTPRGTPGIAAPLRGGRR
jgi:quercetin dioxygenase-like cupin family protein